MCFAVPPFPVSRKQNSTSHPPHAAHVMIEKKSMLFVLRCLCVKEACPLVRVMMSAAYRLLLPRCIVGAQALIISFMVHYVEVGVVIACVCVCVVQFALWKIKKNTIRFLMSSNSDNICVMWLCCGVDMHGRFQHFPLLK